MVAHTVCFTVHNPSRVRVQTPNIGGPSFDAYMRALTIPASRLVAGHDYVFICTGIAGNFRHAAQVPDYIDIVPYLGNPNIGSPQLTWAHRQLFSFAPYLSNFLQPETHTGSPFFILFRKTSWPAATDFNLAAQIKFANVNPTPGHSFDLDALAVQVWDTTELNAVTPTPIWWEWHENITEVDLPDGATTPMILQNFTRAHGTSVNWFVATAVNLTPKSETDGAMFWLDNGGAGQEQFKYRIRPMLHGLPPGTPPRYDWQTYALGQMRAFTFPATWTLRTRAQDSYTGGVRGRHHVSATFAVEMSHADFFLDGPTLEPQPGFWGTGEPWDGDNKELLKGFPYYINGVILAGVATGPAAPSAGRWRTLLEADGLPVSSNFPLAVLSRGNPAENLPQYRVANYAFGDVGGGKHFLNFRGNKHWGDPQPPLLKYDASDCTLIAFNGTIGVVPPAPVIEEPGPETPVLAHRETSVTVSSLPELPFQPSFGGTVSVEGVTRELRTNSGYDITHPKFTKGRRTVRLSWAALSRTDTDTLVAWAKALADTDGAFRWRMVGDPAELPYSILEATITVVDLNSGGPCSVSFDAIQLLFFVP